MNYTEKIKILNEHASFTLAGQDQELLVIKVQSPTFYDTSDKHSDIDPFIIYETEVRQWLVNKLTLSKHSLQHRGSGGISLRNDLERDSVAQFPFLLDESSSKIIKSGIANVTILKPPSPPLPLVEKKRPKRRQRKTKISKEE